MRPPSLKLRQATSLCPSDMGTALVVAVPAEAPKGRRMVEMAGIEPASGKFSQFVSTSLDLSDYTN